MLFLQFFIYKITFKYVEMLQLYKTNGNHFLAIFPHETYKSYLNAPRNRMQLFFYNNLNIFSYSLIKLI